MGTHSLEWDSLSMVCDIVSYQAPHVVFPFQIMRHHCVISLWRTAAACSIAIGVSSTGAGVSTGVSIAGARLSIGVSSCITASNLTPIATNSCLVFVWVIAKFLFKVWIEVSKSCGWTTEPLQNLVNQLPPNPGEWRLIVGISVWKLKQRIFTTTKKTTKNNKKQPNQPNQPKKQTNQTNSPVSDIGRSWRTANCSASDMIVARRPPYNDDYDDYLGNPTTSLHLAK